MKLLNLVSFTLQDFRNGKVDTAFIPKHEEELREVRVWKIQSIMTRHESSTLLFSRFGTVYPDPQHFVLSIFNHSSPLSGRKTTKMQKKLLVIKSNLVLKCKLRYLQINLGRNSLIRILNSL